MHGADKTWNRHVPEDLTGQRFQQLLVLGLSDIVQYPKTRVYRWRCRCTCGSDTVVPGGHLRSGAIVSCGCYRNSGQSNRTHGMSKTKEYRTWSHMIGRCCNPDAADYARYGARGITVCQNWRDSFESFYADMGPAPSPRHQIDRIDNSRGYEPSNCRWATTVEQARNKRSNRMVTYLGTTQPLSAWADAVSISARTLWDRLNLGWSVEATLTTPVNHRKGRRKPSHL